MESPMAETVYGSSTEESHAMSEKVQNLASNIYQELERLIERYDEAAVKELMPLVVSVLESLDSAVMDNQEQDVELELLREDNEQLVTQYEREKQLRKASEQKLLEIEYSTDEEKRNILSKVESLESIVRMLELKSKNSADHASRLEERETEMKKEYGTLHERYTELFKTHMDYIERTKILFGSEKLEALNNKPKTLHFPNIETECTGFAQNQELGRTPNSPMEIPSLVSPNQSSDSNASLKSELQEAYGVGKSAHQGRSRRTLSERGTTEKGQTTDRVLHSDRSTGTRDGWVDDLDANLDDAMVISPELDEVEELDGFSFGLEKRVVKNELRRPNTLYQELSFQDNDALGEMDEGADISESDGDSDRDHKVNDTYFGMGREVENLISENNELLATKNALNVVKDDLIARVDELTSEQEILREELKQYASVKERLMKKAKELEEELRKAKELSEKKSGKSDDEEDLPMAQRKRFTRVEMARVLMERNQYKERLMELQEAVRWTEMIRASRSDSSLDTKRTKSSIWKFFSNLFNTNEKPARKSMPFVNVHYNAPTSNASPALETMRRKRLGDRHRGLDILEGDMMSEKIQQQRARERREQYKQVRAHVRKDDGRLQAYGWSLPSRTPSTPPKTVEANVSPATKSRGSSVPVPVPVFCRPLLEKETGMKVWCSAGVDLTGGKPEGDASISVIGSSRFYVRSAEVGDELARLECELRNQERAHKGHHLSSFVWLGMCSKSSSKVAVINANDPGEILDSFTVCNSHLLCITSVPGAMPSDLLADDKFLQLGKKGPSTKESEDGKVGDVVFVSLPQETDEKSSPNQRKAKPLRRLSSVEANTNYLQEDLNQISSSFAEDSSEQSTSDKPIAEFDHPLAESSEQRCSTEEEKKMSTALPTMWLGTQSGEILLHSSVGRWWQCIDIIKLSDSVLCIVHTRGRVFAGLADGSLVVFHRAADGQWDLQAYHMVNLGRPLHAVRCMSVVDEHVWCGYRNCIHVVDSETLSIVDTFDAHPRKESQVRQMAWVGVGVWVTIRLDSTLRLYHSKTRQHLQDVDIEPYVSKMLGTGKLGFSFVRITALLASCKRLWMGTGNGVVISVPLTETKKMQTSSDIAGRAPGGVVRVYSNDGGDSDTSGFVPYCTMAQAQLSFHGHRDAVKFFVAVPGTAAANSEKGEESASEMQQAKLNEVAHGDKPDLMLILSGGEGYIDFRIGDGEEEEVLTGDKSLPVVVAKGDRSHLIVWQVTVTE